MTIRNTLIASLGAAALFAGSAAFAQGVTAGAKVLGPQGGEVGTVASVDGDMVILRTDRHEIQLPASSFTVTDDGLLFAMTREQVNAQVDQMLAQADAVITVGALVRDRDGAIVGPIEQVDADAVVVKVGETLVRLPKPAVAPGPQGPVVGVTVAEIRAQTGAAAEASTEGSTGAATGATAD